MVVVDCTALGTVGPHPKASAAANGVRVGCLSRRVAGLGANFYFPRQFLPVAAEVGRRSRVAKGKRTSVASDRRLSLSPGSCAFGVGAGAKRPSAVAATVSPLLVPDTGGWKVAKTGGCPRLPVHGAALQPAATPRVRQLRQLMLLTPACRPSCIRWVRPNVAGMLPNDDASSGCLV